ncbi:hypothetical protein OAS39_12700 [Pirellulales bacterium]|nr:hypothetical protein [Pirellulales bacterium]
MAKTWTTLAAGSPWRLAETSVARVLDFSACDRSLATSAAISNLVLGIVLAAGNSATGADYHLQQNLVYRELLEAGVAADGASHKLPAPTLADDLSAADQVERIEELGGTRYPLSRLARKSVVAPQIVRISALGSEDAITPLRTVDVWFVVHAELDVVADPEFLGKLLNSQEGEGQTIGLTPDQLQARDISIADENLEWEGFGHVAYDVLAKVRIRATGRSFWSSSDESIVGAVKLDRRFLGDGEFPNQWSPLDRSGENTQAGPAAPYEGVGFYVKITQMQQPAGALFVEYHLVFAEPTEWFRGANQLGAKLPAVVQSQVRTARREMMTASSRLVGRGANLGRNASDPTGD